MCPTSGGLVLDRRRRITGAGLAGAASRRVAVLALSQQAWSQDEGRPPSRSRRSGWRRCRGVDRSSKPPTTRMGYTSQPIRAAARPVPGGRAGSRPGRGRPCARPPGNGIHLATWPAPRACHQDGRPATATKAAMNPGRRWNQRCSPWRAATMSSSCRCHHQQQRLKLSACQRSAAAAGSAWYTTDKTPVATPAARRRPPWARRTDRSASRRRRRRRRAPPNRPKTPEVSRAAET